MSDNGDLDNLFMTAAGNAGGIQGTIASFFGFLARRTDFFDDIVAAEKLIVKESTRCVKLRRSIKEAQHKDNQPADVSEEQTEPQLTELPKAEPFDRAKDQLSADAVLKENEMKNAKYKQIPGNGYQTDKFWWTQTLNTVEINLALESKTAAKMIRVDVTSKRITVKIHGQIVCDESLSASVKGADSMWTLVDGKTIQITVDKGAAGKWWTKLFEDDEFELDGSALQPENSALSDLEPETRKTVEKMLFEQRQKQMFQNNMQPTNEKMDILKKFQQSHPELDFSKAQVNL